MGNTTYSMNDRSIRATASNFASKSMNQIFEQNDKRRIHESMSPKNVGKREARDSATHPNTVPIILSLDVTGSMGMIPMNLVREGLPKLMGNIIQAGVPDAALLFLAVGDTECDKYPLQVGQFESGDLELDTWLTRTYIEGGGGGNGGESYLLAWYFAAMHTSIDSWEKRKKKGFLFTVGDEPGLKSLPKNVIQELTGDTPQAGFTDEQLLALARETYYVYHLHITQTSSGGRSSSQQYWTNLMGQNVVMVDDYHNIPQIICSIVSGVVVAESTTSPVPFQEIGGHVAPSML